MAHITLHFNQNNPVQIFLLGDILARELKVQVEKNATGQEISFESDEPVAALVAQRLRDLWQGVVQGSLDVSADPAHEGRINVVIGNPVFN